MVAATLACVGGAVSTQKVGVAPGIGTSGAVTLQVSSYLVVFSEPLFFFDISPSRAEVETILPDAYKVHMVTNADGALAVLAAPSLSGDESPLWLTRAPAGTIPGWISSPITDTLSVNLIDGAIGPDTTQYALYLEEPAVSLGLATRRTIDNTFTRAAIVPPASTVDAVAAVDAQGAPHSVYFRAAEQDLVDYQPGRDLVTALALDPISSGFRSMQGVRPSGLGVAFSALLANGVHVLRRRADPAFDDIFIPSTIPLPWAMPLSAVVMCSGGTVRR